MDGRGWKPEYGISPEGVKILGYVEALPKEVRDELADAIAHLCRSEGYFSLHDDLRDALARHAAPEPRSEAANVIPLFRARQRG